MVCYVIVGIQIERLFLSLVKTVDERRTTTIRMSVYFLDLIVNTEGVNSYGNNCVFGCWKNVFYPAD